LAGISEKVAPVRADIALDLINRLSHTDLSLNMQQVRIPNAVKLATSIIAARNQQHEKNSIDGKISSHQLRD
jgi:hypothetical protein